MNDYHRAYSSPVPPRQRGQDVGKALGIAGRILGITVGVILILGALAFVGYIVLLVHGLNSWASNK